MHPSDSTRSFVAEQSDKQGGGVSAKVGIDTSSRNRVDDQSAPSRLSDDRPFEPPCRSAPMIETIQFGTLEGPIVRLPGRGHTVETSSIQWAPVLLEPIPGSEERIIIAIAVVNEGEMRCTQTIDPAIARAVFRDDRKYVADLIDVVTESLSAHLEHNRPLGQWRPPVEGVSLGSEQESRFSDIDELVRRAGSMSTVFRRERFGD